MGQGGQKASAIAGVGFAAAGAPMAHVVQHLPGIEDHLMASSSLDVGNETYATAIFFIGRIVEPVLFRKTFNRHYLRNLYMA